MEYEKMNKNALIEELKDKDKTIQSQVNLANAVIAKDKEINELKELYNLEIKELKNEIKDLNLKIKEENSKTIDDLKQKHCDIINQKDKENENNIKNVNEFNKSIIDDLNDKLSERSELLAKFIDMYGNTLKIQQSSLDAHLEIYENLMNQFKLLKGVAK